jgi:hypothetical protein
MSPGLASYLILLVLSLLVAVILFFVLRVSLRELLRSTVRLPAGVTFYLRSFALVLFLAALSAAIGTSFDLKDAHFLEYVWKTGDGLSSVLSMSLWILAAYAVVVTILVATLKIKDDK